MRIVFVFIIVILLTGFKLMLSKQDQAVIRPLKVIHSNEGSALFVLSENPNLLLELDHQSGKTLRKLELNYRPSGAAINQSGDRIFITANGAEGLVLELDANDFSVLREVKTGGHTPVSPVLSPDEKYLYICHRFNNEVIKYDVSSGSVLERYEVVREPVSLVVSKDGKYLFAGNLIPAGRSDVDRVNAVVSVVGLEDGSVNSIQLPNGSNSIGDMAITSDGAYIYVSHILARYQLPTTQIERGWINTNALSVIDVAQKVLHACVLLDDVDLGFSNPRAVAFSDDEDLLLVSSYGANELAVIDRHKLHSYIMGYDLDQGPSVYPDSRLANDLSVMHAIDRQRVKLSGHGPGSLAVTGNNVYVSEYYSGTISVVDLSAKPYACSQLQAFGDADPYKDVVRYGEMLFNSATLCFQQWQSCVSCHPDARVDGLNWDLLNDGIGNPKNTKSMVYSHLTPPVMALGIRASAELAIRTGIRFIQFAEVDEDKAMAIEYYIKSLEPEPSPFLVNNELSSNALRGKQLFVDEGCAVCHPAPLYTDLLKYDLQTGRGIDEGKPFLTPTLIESWRTAPYMHDGSAATMVDLIKIHNPYGSDSLTEKQFADLAEFVLSL